MGIALADRKDRCDFSALSHALHPPEHSRMSSLSLPITGQAAQHPMPTQWLLKAQDPEITPNLSNTQVLKQNLQRTSYTPNPSSSALHGVGQDNKNLFKELEVPSLAL